MNEYPSKKINDMIDKFFPKGNKDRGAVLLLVAMAFIEGKEKQ
jgi:hypothetical protein